MDIRITTGKPSRVVLSVTEQRGLWSTLEILKAVRGHLEPSLNLDHLDEAQGSAGLLLHSGFEQFVECYAPKPAKQEATETDE
jgi:hypothetical protein